jgi:hypothetical protein
MYDSLYNIQKSINNQSIENETRTIKKYKNENALLLKLEDKIKKYMQENENVYDYKIRDIIILDSLKECFGRRITSNLRYNNPIDFIENYETVDNRIDIEYYYLFANKNYDKICRKIEAELSANTNDYKKIIAFEKLQLDKEKFEHKKSIDYAKINNINYKNNNIDYAKIILIIFKVGCIVAFTPILLTIVFIYGLICGLAKMK